MDINFLKIKIENFLSIGSSEVVLDRDGYTLVRGINNNPNDLAKSNGSGKSSIWEAISWCLTGETIRGTKSDISNIHTDDGALVELEFTCDNKNYRLIRSKDNKQWKTNLRIFIDGEDKSGKGIRDSEKLLSQYLPDLTSSLIGSVIILGQGLPQRFSNNTPSGRKEVLEKLAKSDFMIEDLKLRLASRKTEVAKQLRAVQDTLVASKSESSYIESRLATLERSLENIGNTQDFENNISILNKQLIDIDAKIEEYEKSIAENDNKVVDLRAQYTAVFTNKNNELSQITNSQNTEINKLQKELSSVQAEIRSTRNEITRLENIKDTCPTCGQKLVGVTKPDTSSLRSSLKDLSSQEEKLKVDYMQLSTKINETTNAINLKYNDALKKIESDGKTINSIISSLKNDLSNIRRNKSNIESSIFDFQHKINNFVLTKTSLENDIEKCKNEINELSSKILYNNSMEQDFVQHQDVLGKFNTIITRDFRGYLLLNVINYINTRAKYYSSYIFETDKIDFCLDGNNINITYDEKQYENLSGGEKQKVDLIVQFSIKDMLCNFLNFSSNILVIDEIFDNLDSIGCQKVVNLISTQLHDIKSIYVVTHRADLDIPVDHELVVVKNENGISEINGTI